MNQLIPEIVQRRARRALSEKPIPKEVVDRLLTAATLAPSCFNNQPWRFLVLDNTDSLAKAKPFLAGGNYWAMKAQLIILVLTKKDLDCQLSDNREYAPFGVGLAVQNLLLQATREGLYAHPIAGYQPVELKAAFGIDLDYDLVTLVVVGHPGDEQGLNEKHLQLEHAAQERKPKAEVIHYNVWR